MSNDKHDNAAAGGAVESRPADSVPPVPDDPFVVFSEWAGKADRLAYGSLAAEKPSATKPRR